MDVHRFSRDDLADQALGNGLTFFKESWARFSPQQVAKRSRYCP